MIDWRRTTVSADGTHHLVNGEPLYAGVFIQVLKFHEPGLAPAMCDDGAMHIDAAGRPRYLHRYARTFGFYEGLAAVDNNGAWFHIDPCGHRAYSAAWAWCGNFQGGRCSVRHADGRYRHLDAQGAPAYEATWRYVGDFRDAIAVVQGDDGLHCHIDRHGGALHNHWYLDLDVFHKGLARARDRAGWTHVDQEGVPVYARRFASIEPFYNGQARIERFDGGLEVVDEEGRTVVELRPSNPMAETK